MQGRENKLEIPILYWFIPNRDFLLARLCLKPLGVKMIRWLFNKWWLLRLKRNRKRMDQFHERLFAGKSGEGK